jgi:hypothetical protein
MDVAVFAFEGGFPFAEGGVDGFGFVDVDFVLDAIPGERAIHRAGVHVNKTKGFGDELGVGALAARACAVNGDDDWVFQIVTRDSLNRLNKLNEFNCPALTERRCI